MQLSGRTPGDCGNCPMPMKLSGIQPGYPMDQFVGNLRPFGAGFRSADVMAHAAGSRREQRHVGAALALEFQLRLHAFAQLIVADLQIGGRGLFRRILQRRDLSCAKHVQRLGLGGVVAVAVHHQRLCARLCEGPKRSGRGAHRSEACSALKQCASG
jgi:hypothetical protein